MSISVFELFKVGVGPSSSHTMGPMTAACRFVRRVAEGGRLAAVARVEVQLYGSLALTGRGHATDTAAIIGLTGQMPADADPDACAALVARVLTSRRLPLNGGDGHEIDFDADRDIRWEGGSQLPFHPNAITFVAFDATGAELTRGTYYSVGGGFVLDEDEARANAPANPGPAVPYDFANADQLLDMAAKSGLSIAELMRENERAGRTDAEIDQGLDRILGTMDACIDRGMRETGILPGGLEVPRRAAKIHAQLLQRQERMLRDPLSVMDWVNLWALAVNEENAAGGKVVTSPTNGAAGIIPAVLRYYERFHDPDRRRLHIFLLTAAAIGGLYKRNASISAAEVGCQGEVGVACSMAAAGLTAAMGGTNAQIENAAEIGMEHNLGLTCDPIKGLVQIPCIERNAMGAIKAIDAARLALMGDGTHKVSLDRVIETMRRTGADMKDLYKETSLGGLAVNLPEC
ncbi:L-serine ammonia-lyase [Nitrospirillum viridazoti]|uniref:L-serine dehydratase n=2 Tax=Nitrospirillum TaxID=1543705 RepID=A0A560IBN1_9PROT|nr:L-serine ammonia-lyase [Nitrospirillum amazonense]TWB56458.1 L-serine ammonia-lyase [Nitrospirillum amazonense]